MGSYKFNIDEFESSIRQIWYVAKLAGVSEILEAILLEHRSNYRLIDEMSIRESQYISQIENLKRDMAHQADTDTHDPNQDALAAFLTILRAAATDPEPLLESPMTECPDCEGTGRDKRQWNILNGPDCPACSGKKQVRLF